MSIQSNGRTGFIRWALGSMTQRVVKATKLPMLIVQPQKKP
jgi:nucleotide-binding universal stress UspA family protein